MPRNVIEIANPRRYGETCTSMIRAIEYCNRGLAYFLKDGRLKFRASQRQASDVYVDRRGTIWWNGARSHYVDGKDIAMFPPCCNVAFPKTGTRRAARRYAQ
jgi:hypothetical protein